MQRTRSKTARWCALLAAACLAAAGAAGAKAQSIVGGSPTAGFAAVGIGIQVTPDWVLSAYHATLQVGDVYNNGYGPRVVLARYDAPGSGQFPGNDLSLVRLAPVAGPGAYLSVNGSVFANGAFGPLAATIVSAGNQQPRGYAFTTISEAMSQYDPDDNGPDPAVAVNWLVSWDSVVHVEGGDSRGGLFAGHVTDSSWLLGITSALLTDDNDQPIGSAFVQPAAYRSWIDAVMAADGADNQIIAWATTPVPEPASLALMVAGLTGMAAAARAVRRRGASGVRPSVTV